MNSNAIERLIELIAPRTDTENSESSPTATSYETTTRQMVHGVEEDVRSLRRRLDALIFMVLSAILTEAATRLFGG